MKPMGARETVAVGLLCHAVCGPRGSLGVGRAFLGVSVWRVSVMCKCGLPFETSFYSLQQFSARKNEFPLTRRPFNTLPGAR